MNTTNGEIESEFHSYVQPGEHPILSTFCTELTGITQTQVEAGVPLRICLSRFMRWLHELQREKGVVFVNDSKNSTPSENLCTFVTWSDWDLGVCLLYECKRKQISKPGVLNSWIDLRATYKCFYSRKPKGLQGALQDVGIEFSGREHCGLDDARNTARLAWRMILDGCVMKVTKSLSRPQLKSRPECGDVLICDGPQTEKQPSHSENQVVQRSSPTAPASVCQSLVSPHTVLPSLTTPGCVNTPLLGLTLLQSSSNMISTTNLSTLDLTPELPPSDMTPDPETPVCDWPESCLLTEVGESGSYDDVLLEEEATVTGEKSPSHIRPSSIPVQPSADSHIRPSSIPVQPSADSHIRPSSLPVQPSADSHIPPSTVPVQPSADSHGSNDTHMLSRTQSACQTNLNEKLSGTFSHSISNPARDPLPLTTAMPHPSRPHPSKPHPSRPHPSKPHPSRPSSTFAPPLPLLDPYKSLTSRGDSATTTPRIPFTIYRDQVDASSESSRTSVGRSSCVASSVLSSVVNRSSNSSCSGNQSDSSCSHTQSALSSCSVHQSALSDHSLRQSRVSSSNQSAASSCSTKCLSVPPQRGRVKITSPLCDCGRRTKRLTVCNGGPNHGRAFYTCTVRKSNAAGPAPHHGCGFFKWESALLKSSSLGQTTMTLNLALTRAASRTFR
ncbi:ERI1 exoribonuclease 2-like isoform X2 [Brachyhypopomus gauderio]